MVYGILPYNLSARPLDGVVNNIHTMSRKHIYCKYTRMITAQKS